jgi:hypothetical protein
MGVSDLRKPPSTVKMDTLEIAAVPEEILENAMQNFEERLQMFVQQKGRHLTDIIFRT